MSEPRATTDASRSNPAALTPVILALLKDGASPTKPAALNEFSRKAIPHDHFKDGIGYIARLHQEFDPNFEAEAGFLLFRGRPRSGKTHVLKFYERQFPKTRGPLGWIRPVVYVRAPANGGSTSLLKAILKKLGVQVFGGRHSDDLLTDIEHHLVDQGVQLLILDEFQHVVDQRTDRFQYMAAEILKNLLSMNACQMVFGGLDMSVKIMRLNQQFAGRMSDEFQMLPYSWTSKDDQEHYKDYLGGLADLMVKIGMFSVRPALDEDEFAQRIHCATDGLAGLTSRLLRKAADIAMRADAATIAMEHLREAFERMKQVNVVVNPFVGDTCPEDLGNPAEELLATGPEEDEETNLSKRKERTPKASFSR